MMSFIKRWGLFALMTLLAWPAAGQEGRGDVVYVPTPQVVVDEMLRMAKVTSNDYIIDLGSGDGRIVITAAKQYGARGFGVDLDTYLLKLAREAAKKQGVSERAQFVEQNLFETDLSKATVLTTYLLPEMNARLVPKILGLRPGTRVVAHDYDMGDWYPDEQKTLIVPEKTVGDPGKSYVFLWIVPANAAGRWQSQLAVGGKPVNYEFSFQQRYQNVTGNVRIGAQEAQVPNVKLIGDRISFELKAPGAAAHRFEGRIKQDTIEGTVSISEGAAQKQQPWVARLLQRGQARTGPVDAAAAGVTR
jgi:hypothetical protein